MKLLLPTMTIDDATFAVSLPGIQFLPMQAGLRLVKYINQNILG